MKESRAIYEDVLSKPFDFNLQETINVDYDKLPYSKNKAELMDRWRKQLKLSALSTISEKQKLEEDKKKDDAK
jgi:carboxyl-terminal processing protease